MTTMAKVFQGAKNPLSSKQLKVGTTVISLALLAILAIRQLRKFYPPDMDASGNSDAFYTYLPAARAILDRGWSFFFNDPQSYHVAPLGYLWPALWEADITTIRWANGGLFLVSVAITWFAAKRLGGWIGAIAAALLLIYHPAITLYMPKILTEPIYLAGLSLMTWSIVEIIYSPQKNTHRWFIFCAIGLSITLLSRPVLQIMVLGALALAVAGLFSSHTTEWHGTLRKTVIMLISASILPVCVAVKNGVQFGVWGIGTGSGAGMYYGVNPLRLGHEPAYMGFEYEIGRLVYIADNTTQGHPLDKRADKIERAAAISIVKSTSIGDNIRFFGNKLYSWIFYSTPELAIISKLRSFRLFELFCIGIGAALWFWSAGKNYRKHGRLIFSHPSFICAGVLTAGTVLMVAQLTPLLYNTRYNGIFLEPWLLLLTAAALGKILPSWKYPNFRSWGWSTSPWRQLAGLAAVIFVSVAITKHAIRHETLPIDPHRLGPATTVLPKDYYEVQSFNGVEQLQDGQWKLTGSPATLTLQPKADMEFPSMKFLDGVWRFQLLVDAKEPKRCRTASVRLEHAASEAAWPPPELRLTANGTWQTYALYGNHYLRPAQPGKMWITLNCTPGTLVAWGGAELLRSTLPEAAQDLIQHGIPIDPYQIRPAEESAFRSRDN